MGAVVLAPVLITFAIVGILLTLVVIVVVCFRKSRKVEEVDPEDRYIIDDQIKNSDGCVNPVMHASRSITPLYSQGRSTSTLSVSSSTTPIRSCSMSSLATIRRAATPFSLHGSSMGSLRTLQDKNDRDSEKYTDENVDEYSDGGMSKDLKNFLNLYDLSPIMIPRQHIRTGRLMMKGYNFSICCGSMRAKNGTYTAYAKPITIQIFKGLNSDQDRINMLKNVKLLVELRHPNIQQVYGVCTEGSPATRDGVEVLTAMDRTHFHVTLHRLLTWTKENNPELLNPHCAMTFAVQICHGAKYLEQQKILHKNLMASTVMVDRRCTIKLAGIEIDPISTQRPTVRWMALESMRQGVYTFKSIVWSFGVLLWEMATLGQKPFPHLRSKDVYLYLSKGKRLIRPDGCSKQLYDVMKKCWQEKPRERPTFDQLIYLIQTYQSSLPSSRPPEEIFPDRDNFWEDEYI